MADNLKRKCFKCGRSPATDSDIKLYRFPCPGPTNAQRCELWAKFCFPEGAWDSSIFQRKLYDEHRMLCNKHFPKTSFTNYSEKKLNRHAVPDAENEHFQTLDNIAVQPQALKTVVIAICPTQLDITNIHKEHSYSATRHESLDPLQSLKDINISTICCLGTGTSLHRFPDAKRFPERLRAWVRLLGGKLETELDFEQYRKKMVCDRHFTKTDKNRYARLNALAIPSLFLSEFRFLATEFIIRSAQWYRFLQSFRIFPKQSYRDVLTTLAKGETGALHLEAPVTICGLLHQFHFTK